MYPENVKWNAQSELFPVNDAVFWRMPQLRLIAGSCEIHTLITDSGCRCKPYLTWLTTAGMSERETKPTDNTKPTLIFSLLIFALINEQRPDIERKA